ncbi:hypothetical protein [Endozoicomonas sp.]|uniref:hypothetical protein n=1 Tax=Endozoicomonas sp. TaxID=1892382 RepID=UPI00288825D7|nr:hypothetical protein [Endozoicomonas sp.]
MMEGLGSIGQGSTQTIQNSKGGSNSGKCNGSAGGSGLEVLQKKWNDRINEANDVISKRPDKSKPVAQNLVNKFGILTESAKSEEMTDELTKFLSLVLAYCNLANESNLSQLHEVCNDYTKHPYDHMNELLETLDGKLTELQGASKADSQTISGHYSMAVERQKFVESDIKAKFEDEDTQRQIKNALVLINNQITLGFDIGPIPDDIVILEFDSSESIKKFAIQHKYPSEHRKTDRDIYENDYINQDYNVLPEASKKELIKKLKEMEKEISEASSAPPGRIFSDADLKLIEESLGKPICVMSGETLCLASFETSDDRLKGYLESCYILKLKTPEKKEVTGAGNTDPDLQVFAKNDEVKRQEVIKHQNLLAKAVLESVAIKREYADHEGLPAAPKYAARALIRSITPQIGIAV